MDDFDDPKVKKYLAQFSRDVLPNIKASAFVINIAASEPDAKQCLEIGAAILLDKPLIVAVFDSTKVSANLKRVATEIVELSILDPEGSQIKLHDAIRRLITNDQRARRPQ